MTLAFRMMPNNIHIGQAGGVLLSCERGCRITISFPIEVWWKATSGDERCLQNAWTFRPGEPIPLMRLRRMLHRGENAYELFQARDECWRCGSVRCVLTDNA